MCKFIVNKNNKSVAKLKMKGSNEPAVPSYPMGEKSRPPYSDLSYSFSFLTLTMHFPTGSGLSVGYYITGSFVELLGW